MTLRKWLIALFLVLFGTPLLLICIPFMFVGGVLRSMFAITAKWYDDLAKEL